MPFLVTTRFLWFSFLFFLTLVLLTLCQDWAKGLFIAWYVYLFVVCCVFLSTINNVLFVVHYGKGMFSTLLGVCTSCVACPRVGFDWSCPSINVHPLCMWTWKCELNCWVLLNYSYHNGFESHCGGSKIH